MKSILCTIISCALAVSLALNYVFITGMVSRIRDQAPIMDVADIQPVALARKGR